MVNQWDIRAQMANSKITPNNQSIGTFRPVNRYINTYQRFKELKVVDRFVVGDEIRLASLGLVRVHYAHTVKNGLLL